MLLCWIEYVVSMGIEEGILVVGIESVRFTMGICNMEECVIVSQRVF